jgi:uncharacterized membrane protein
MALCSIALAAGIVGVVTLVKGALWRRRVARGGGCGGRAAPPRGWRRGAGPIGGSRWLRALYARLDTTPGQEREIRAALEDLRDRALEARADAPEVRAGIGKALSGEAFDASAFAAVGARVDASTEKLKDALAAALQRVHGALDPKQRERLAEIVSSGIGPWRGGFRGASPYRGDAV